MWGHLRPTPALAVLLFAATGCRPATVTVSTAPIPPPPPAPAAIVPVATAPAIPLTEAPAFHDVIAGQIDNFIARRADLLGAAMEPGERELHTTPESTRLNKKYSLIEAHFNAGEELFEFQMTANEGFGDGIGGKPPNMHRVHRGAHGGPDTTNCKSCHHRGGDDGAGEFPEAALTGGDGMNTLHSNERNAPALLGGGAIQVLAQEVTRNLADQVRPLAGIDYDRELEYQGVNFGTVHIHADGKVDTDRVTALDDDLVVRPFGWKGTHSTLRRFAEEAFQVHHGMQSEVLVSHRREFGPMPIGSSPATLAVFRELGNGPDEDPDKDGRLLELNGDFLTSIAVYLTLLPLPVIDPPRSPDLLAAFRRGEATFRAIGCADCHKPSWLIKEPVWHERGETPFSRDELTLDLRKDIQRGQQLSTIDTVNPGNYPVFIYSDLRRHDMGPELADSYSGAAGPHPGERRGPRFRPIPPSYFLTRPLWGLADSGPYLHDGRAVTVPDAILAHGGEAQKARDAFAQLKAEDQRAVHVFLLSLTRPPIPEVVP